LEEHQINPQILNQTSSNLEEIDRLNRVELEELGSDRAEFTPVEKKEPTPFDEAGSRQLMCSSLSQGLEQREHKFYRSGHLQFGKNTP
jgi:hypothetical protein